MLIALHAGAGAFFIGVSAALRRKRGESDAFAIWLPGILGVRHLAESGVLCRRHSKRWILRCAAVDGAHATSMLAAAAAYPPRRVLLLANAVEASCFAALAGAIAAGSKRRRSQLDALQHIHAARQERRAPESAAARAP